VSDRPLVSIVTPSLNQGRYIRATVESVLNQDYPHIDYVVMDGGSTDETLGVLRQYGPRLRWQSAPDGGQAAAINMGWRRGIGSVLAYLNSDDTYLPGAVARAVDHLGRHPEAGGVYGEGYHVDEEGRVLERYPTEPFNGRRLAETCFICQPAVFLRREVVERVGYLDESLQYCMDYDLWIRASRAAPLAHLPEYLATTRLHAETKTLGQRARVHGEILRVVRHHFGAVPPSWVYAYAHAVLGPVDRAGAWTNARFVLRLVGISLATFMRYNRAVPAAEWRRWGTWLRGAWQQLAQRPA
jgi:glycosyltransferase involved in cell wall biosynthesis